MKPTMALSVCVLAAGLAVAQNPSVIQNTRATKNGVRIHFIEPGKPTQNAFIESLNGRFRAECLDRNLFENLDAARIFISQWKRQYENERPHSSLGGLTPIEFEQGLKRCA